MTTSTGLAPSEQRERDGNLSPIPAAAAAAHGRHPFAQTSPSTRATQPCATVAQKETGSHSPSELVLVAHQPPPAVMNRSPLQAAPPPCSALRRCCGCSACTRVSVTCIIAYRTPAVESSIGLDLTTGCQFQLWRTTVQESLRGYVGPSALVC